MKMWRISPDHLSHDIMLLAKHISENSNILQNRISGNRWQQCNMEVTPTNILQDLLPEKNNN